MTDFATLRCTNATSLTDRVGREVVVVHVATALVGGNRVDHLLHARHAEGRHVDDLGFATLEEG